jgi:hypothetical protein
MPEPEPYSYESGTRPSHHTSDVYTSSSDLLRQATTGNKTNRLGPVASVAASPSARNGSFPSVTLSPNNPPDDLPPGYTGRLDPSSVALDNPSLRNSSHTGYSYLDAMNSTSSVRPPGASPPTIPGFNGYESPPRPNGDVYSNGDVSSNLRGYHHKLAEQYNPATRPPIGKDHSRSASEHVTPSSYFPSNC